MFDRITAVITIAIAVAVYFLTGYNIWMSVIAIVAIALISRSLKMIFQDKLDKHFPPLTVFFLTKDDLSQQSSKGMRVIVITEGIFFHTETEAHVRGDRHFHPLKSPLRTNSTFSIYFYGLSGFPACF